MAEEVDVKKLAEWAGFKQVTRKEPYDIGHYTLWENDLGYSQGKLPDFPNDEAPCYRWLVPEAIKRGYRVELHSYKGLNEGDETHIAIIKSIHFPYDYICCFVQPKPALALCRSFEKLIEWEKKK